MLRKFTEKFFRFPARVLDKSVDLAKRGEKALISKKPFKVAEEYLNTLGPGVVTGAADDDPSGIATYSQIGAKFGFQFLWLSVFTFPFMSIVQELCARIGLVTGEGLAANIKKHFSRKTLFTITFLLFIVNTFNIGADLGMMAASTRLIFPELGFNTLIIFFVVVSLMLQVFTTYARYAKYLKYMTLTLFAYVFTVFALDLDWYSILKVAFVPQATFSRDSIFLVCAVLGTTISPYLFFWQTSQEVEEEILQGAKNVKSRMALMTDVTLKKMRIDIWSGMLFSNVIMFFIITACAATLFQSGITIETADQAAQAIRPFAGELTYFFFTVGIIGTGLLATPVLAGSTAYAVSESMGWKSGLYHKLRSAYSFYGVIIVSMVIGIVINLVGMSPIKTLIYAAVLNGMLAPVILYFVVKLSGKKSVMKEYRASKFIRAMGWLIIVVMVLAGAGAIASVLI